MLHLNSSSMTFIQHNSSESYLTLIPLLSSHSTHYILNNYFGYAQSSWGYEEEKKLFAEPRRKKVEARALKKYVGIGIGGDCGSNDAIAPLLRIVCM